jgi:hypothetical protein
VAGAHVVLEAGETPKAGLLREIREELAHRKPIRLQPLLRKVEGEGLSWFTEAEVRRLAMRPEDRTAVGKYFSLV